MLGKEEGFPQTCRFFVGGFLFENPFFTGSKPVFNGVTDLNPANLNIPAGDPDSRVFVVRMSSCKIDELRISTVDEALAVNGDAIPSRFAVSASGSRRSFWHGSYPVKASGEIWSVAFTTLDPVRYRGNDFTDSDVPFLVGSREIKLELDCEVDGAGSFVGSEEGSKTLDAPIPVVEDDELEYTIRFLPDGPEGLNVIRNVAPIVDEILIYIQTPPTFFHYEQVFLR